MKTLVLCIAVIALIAAAIGCSTQSAPTAPELPKIASAPPGAQDVLGSDDANGAATECQQVTTLYTRRLENLQNAIDQVSAHGGSGPALDALIEQYNELLQEFVAAYCAACVGNC